MGLASARASCNQSPSSAAASARQSWRDPTCAVGCPWLSVCTRLDQTPVGSWISPAELIKAFVCAPRPRTARYRQSAEYSQLLIEQCSLRLPESALFSACRATVCGPSSCSSVHGHCKQHPVCFFSELTSLFCRLGLQCTNMNPADHPMIPDLPSTAAASALASWQNWLFLCLLLSSPSNRSEQRSQATSPVSYQKP